MVQRLIKYKAFTGKLFDSPEEALEHEKAVVEKSRQNVKRHRQTVRNAKASLRKSIEEAKAGTTQYNPFYGGNNQIGFWQQALHNAKAGGRWLHEEHASNLKRYRESLSTHIREKTGQTT